MVDKSNALDLVAASGANCMHGFIARYLQNEHTNQNVQHSLHTVEKDRVQLTVHNCYLFIYPTMEGS